MYLFSRIFCLLPLIFMGLWFSNGVVVTSFVVVASRTSRYGCDKTGSRLSVARMPPKSNETTTSINTVAAGSHEGKSTIRSNETATSKSDDSSYSPTRRFNNELYRLVQTKTLQGAQQAQEMLDAAVERARKNPQQDDILPNAVSFTAVIKGWAQQVRPHNIEPAHQAQKVFEDLWKWSQEQQVYDNKADYRPNIHTYHALLLAWSAVLPARQNNPQDILPKDQQVAVTQLVKTLEYLKNQYEATDKQDPNVQPTAKAYNMVVNALARVQQTDLAEGVLQEMQTLHQTDKQAYGHLEPDATAWGALMNAHASRGNSTAAFSLLQRLTSLYELGYQQAQPNTVVYNSCLNAFAKGTSSGSPDQALLLLKWMEASDSAPPNIISYSTCINAFAKNSQDHPEQAGPMAQKVWDRCIHRYLTANTTAQANAVRPTTIAYSALFHAWDVSSRAADEKEKQQKIAAQVVANLEQMCLLHRSSMGRVCKPNRVVWNLVFQILERCGDEAVMQQCRQYQESIERLDYRG